MRIFIDTANIFDIKQACRYGYVSGVTTNPSLLARENQEPMELLEAICQAVDGPVNAEVLATDVDGMVTEAHQYAAINPNIVIKIPMSPVGLEAVHKLDQAGIKTNVTLIFSANQALLAARAGASYVSPFIGRLDDIGHDGIAVVEEIATIFCIHEIDCQIIAASIRHPAHVTAAALAGADIATIPFAVLTKMTQHPLTTKGIAKFESDWQNRPNK